MRQGKVTTNGVVLRMHENATVVFLTQQGYDVSLIPPVQRKGARTPDIRIGRLEWEIKCPVGTSANTIKRAFKVALRQSSNIIFDFRNSKMPDRVNISKVQKEFSDIKSAKRLMVITRRGELMDLHK